LAHARTISLPSSQPAADPLGFQLHQPPSPTANPHPFYEHRYQILHLHAKGNLGEVFCAQDHHIGRHVALKRIQARHAEFADRLDQFEIEARITGSLEHPAIVPVYSLGRGPDGRPFYTMRLIRGISLRHAISDYHALPLHDLSARRSTLRALVRRFITVCQALAYAHSRGVLHRDIKPSNIMLGDFGETLLVDWGLAKAQGFIDNPSTASPEGPLRIADAPTESSLPGGIKGTIPYMSPEQANGQPLDSRSDIYSLGATLYSLLTGRLPHEQTDSRQLLEAVRRGQLPSPRTICRDVPPALDAICRKATAPNPNHRYPTAQALADDLTRWIDDEPVLAYPEPWTARLRRWTRKHPAASGTAVTTLAMLALASIPLGLLLRSEAAARARAVQLNAQLSSQRQRTEAQFHQTRSLVDDFTDLVSGQLLILPGAENFRHLVVDKAAQRYQQFLSERPDDPQIAAQAAHIFRVAANSNRALEVESDPNSSTAQLYNQAFNLARQTAHLNPAFTYRPILTLIDRAEWHRLQGRLDLAESDLRHALDLTNSIPAPRQTTLGNHLAHGLIHLDLAAILLDRGQPDAAQHQANSALEHLAIVTAQPDCLWVHHLLHLQARRLLLDIDASPTNRPNPAAVESLLADSAQLLQSHRSEFDTRFFHASSLLLRTRAAFDPAAGPAAAKTLADRLRDDARHLLTLFQAHPNIPFLRRAASETYTLLAEIQRAAQIPASARQNAAHALRLARAGSQPEDDALAASALNLLAQLAQDDNQTDNARDLYEQALTAIDSAITRRPLSQPLRRTRDEIRARRDTLTPP
jgi:serine/threonine protein kinase